MAAINYYSGSGTLVFLGDATRNNLASIRVYTFNTVKRLRATLVVKNSAGTIIEKQARDFLEASVKRIHFSGGSGDDRFYNYSDITCRALGRDGSDQLVGGMGPDTLSGGNGTDRLEGWLSEDSLLGGNGTDFIYGGLGNDTLKAGPDTSKDYLKGGTGQDTFLADPGDEVSRG